MLHGKLVPSIEAQCQSPNAPFLHDERLQDIFNCEAYLAKNGHSQSKNTQDCLGRVRTPTTFETGLEMFGKRLEGNLMFMYLETPKS